MEPQVGSVLEGRVTSIMKFGAFVALEGGGSGLVHISEIANTFVEDVHDHLQAGQTVKVLVLSAENGRVNLSIKKAQPDRRLPRAGAASRSGAASRTGTASRSGAGPRTAAASRPPQTPAQGGEKPAPLPPSEDQAFEDKLKRFLSSSEGKMADLNRSMDGKRGRRRR